MCPSADSGSAPRKRASRFESVVNRLPKAADESGAPVPEREGQRLVVKENHACFAQRLRGSGVDLAVADDHAELRGELDAAFDQARNAIGDRSRSSRRAELVNGLVDCVDEPKAVRPDPIENRWLVED